MLIFARTLSPLLNTLATRLIVSSTHKKSFVPASYSTNNAGISSNTARSSLYDFTDDELAMRDAVRKFSHERIAPLVKKMDEVHRLDPDLMTDLFQNGIMGIEIEEKYGGSGQNFMSTILAVEELAKVDPSVAALVDVHSTVVVNVLAKVGTDEQKAKYLPKLAQEYPGSFCLSEPSSGSDAFAMKTTAKKDGDFYVINGSKMWISNSASAGVFLVMANADPSKGYRGISTFIVEKGAEGLTVGKRIEKLGICASDTCPIFFDNVRVHKENILGQLGHGYKYAAGFLNEGRIGVSAIMLGLAQGCLEVTLPYLMERKQFGSKIFDFQGMQFQVAEIATQIEAGRLLAYNAARLKENGQPFLKQAAMAKYYACEVAQATTVKCIDWMGGVGFTKDFPQEKFYRDVKVGAIIEGKHKFYMILQSLISIQSIFRDN